MMKLEIDKAIRFLEKGKTILCPTDTIWGISCDATNFEAVEKVFVFKKRDKSKSLIILVSSLEMLKHYIGNISASTYKIIDETEKPLTVIYSNPNYLASNTLAGDGSIAVRWVKSGFCHELIKAFGKPIVSSSANFSNEKTALTFAEIDEKFKAQMDFVVAERYETSSHKSSRIIKLLGDDILVIRA